MTKPVRTLLISVATAAIVLSSAAQNSTDSLHEGFKNPPDSARPRVWWHWMNGNITEQGIKLDLEWMHRVGIGGFQNFDAALETPQVVPHRLAYMTPDWAHAFLYATKLAQQLHLEEAIAGSPGWSETGGPWVPPVEAMKKYVWSETLVNSGKPFDGKLTQPPGDTGLFQSQKGPDRENIPSHFYVDSAVLAYRTPAEEVGFESLHPEITSSDGPINSDQLRGADLNKSVSLRRPAIGEKAWIQYKFAQPQSISAFTLVMGKQTVLEEVSQDRASDSGHTLEVSDDGATWRVVATVAKNGSIAHTVSIPPVRAKYFRLAFRTLPIPALNAFRDVVAIPAAPSDVRIAEVALYPAGRVNEFEQKAGFNGRGRMPDLYKLATPPVSSGNVIPLADVVDLTSNMKSDGTLHWDPPPGNWKVLRFGYSLLGTTNHPATGEATGLEVDKLNATDVQHYMEKYLDNYKAVVGPSLMGPAGIRYVVTDSWEAGSQNWTDNMIAEFTKRRGYDPRPWMPVLAGHIVQSSSDSDRFLWDFRETIGDLIADNHYGQLNATLQAHGIGQYGESHETTRAFLGDGMQVKKYDQIPMSAMWTQSPGVNNELYGYDADDRESASVAHIYGRPYVAAESMTAGTAPWAWSPSTLKPTADQELLNGINRFVIHCSVHQPLVDSPPGVTLGKYGQWFTRNETWAEQARPWVDYLARSSYMLQQGRFAADVLYFYGEDSNLTQIFALKAPDVPPNYGFDYVNADALIHEISVANHELKTASGMKYHVLVLDSYSQHMSLPVLRAIHSLVERGAVVAGPKPIDDPSMADNQIEFQRMADELFGDGTGVHLTGSGKVYAGQNATAALQALSVEPDVEPSGKAAKNLRFVHRVLADGDLYFVDNRSDRDADAEVAFRITGREPELWHAETGMIERVSYRMEGDRTIVPMHFDPWGAVFVVFRQRTERTSLVVPGAIEKRLTTLSGPWSVAFQENRGAPTSITLNALTSWSDSGDAGVRYFSGTATYSRTLQADSTWFSPDAHLWLDLGDVKNLAEVVVNGKSLGIVWHTPYRVDLTSALVPGNNRIEISVTNAWVNRLIGDEQLGVTKKYTLSTFHPYKADSPLLPSGLLGPVQLYSSTQKP